MAEDQSVFSPDNDNEIEISKVELANGTTITARNDAVAGTCDFIIEPENLEFINDLAEPISIMACGLNGKMGELFRYYYKGATQTINEQVKEMMFDIDTEADLITEAVFKNNPLAKQLYSRTRNLSTMTKIIAMITVHAINEFKRKEEEGPETKTGIN